MPIYKMNGKKYGLQKYRVRINYHDSMGAPRQIDRVAYGLEEAKLLEMQLTHDIKEEAPAKSLTVNQLFEEYISVKKFEVRESTLDKSIRNITYYILPDLESVKLDKLTLRVLQNWKLGIEKRNLALKTRQNIFAEFRALLNYAVKMEYISKNPLTKVGNFKNSTGAVKSIDYYTADEFKLFISQALKYAQERNNINGWDYYAFFNIAFYTGLRKGEIHALKWTDIEDSYLHVRRSITQKLKGVGRTLQKV